MGTSKTFQLYSLALDDRPLHVSRSQMLGYQFGGKAYGHPRLMKQRQLKSQY